MANNHNYKLSDNYRVDFIQWFRSIKYIQKSFDIPFMFIPNFLNTVDFRVDGRMNEDTAWYMINNKIYKTHKMDKTINSLDEFYYKTDNLDGHLQIRKYYEDKKSVQEIINKCRYFNNTNIFNYYIKDKSELLHER